ncbi:MAG: glutamate--tRNA ligase [Lachnospiraceae bacterium]|nr:glutamate--tRNA ligase [Lachnospiraceae bacterium]
MKIRTRYAPSPTGRMHVGNLRTALYEYLVAKHEGGDFLLRIEDTDQERYVEGAVDLIYESLKDAGLSHDEGPDIGGEVGPYVQSERVKSGIYQKYAEELVAKKEAYYCFCTKERLESLKQNIDGKEVLMYDKHCLSLTEEEVQEKLAAGVPHVIRQNNPREGKTVFHDELYGDIEVDNAELDDMILIKSDGYPTYNFANVVDDHLMGITHVVRGNEYISSTPKYNRLYEAFGWEIPVYIHCPLITDEEHKKLSKRSGHSSFEDLTDLGFLPEVVVNFVALLGWSPEDNREILSLSDLVECFDYHRISKSPAVFDYQKLRWMNGEYIKAMDPQRFYDMAAAEIKKAVPGFEGDEDKLRKIASMVQSRVELVSDIPEMIGFLEELPDYDTALYCHKKMKTDEASSAGVLKEILPFLESLEDYHNDALYAKISEWITEHGYKNGYVLWPLRIALSGQATTPCGATEILELLGKEESLSRIRKGAELLASK